MATRFTAAFREIFLRWDRYTSLQFTAPMTIRSGR
jgi:hypothetical protein